MDEHVERLKRLLCGMTPYICGRTGCKSRCKVGECDKNESDMDKRARAEVVNVVKDAMRVIMEQYDEQWLTAKELMAQYQMFTPDWLKRYGELLPRTQAVVTDADGVEHRTGWTYPKNKIARMIADGSIEQLRQMRP